MLNTQQCIDQIKEKAKKEKEMTNIVRANAYITIAEYLERHHQDIVNYTDEEDIPTDFLRELDREFEDVQRG